MGAKLFILIAKKRAGAHWLLSHIMQTLRGGKVAEKILKTVMITTFVPTTVVLTMNMVSFCLRSLSKNCRQTVNHKII